MPHRFYHPDLIESGSVILEGTEAHHLIHVLRHQAGGELELFNGSGLVAQGKIAAVRKRDAVIEITSSRFDPLPNSNLTLATAVPKGERFEWLVEKATELGVGKLIPILTVRSVVDPRNSKLDKLRNAVVAACKQSGRNHLMQITAVTSWNDLLKNETSGRRVLIAHPQGRLISVPERATGTPVQPMTVIIGPEGGFTDEEIQTAVSIGAEPITLGTNILRIETAAIALAAKLLI